MMVFDVIERVRSAPLDPRYRHLALLLATYVNDKTGTAFPGVATLAKELGKTERAVHTGLRALRTCGLLTVECRARVDGTRQPAGGRGYWAHYRFHLEGLARPRRVNPGAPFRGPTGGKKGELQRTKRVNCSVREGCTAGYAVISTEISTGNKQSARARAKSSGAAAPRFASTTADRTAEADHRPTPTPEPPPEEDPMAHEPLTDAQVTTLAAQVVAEHPDRFYHEHWAALTARVAGGAPADVVKSALDHALRAQQARHIAALAQRKLRR